MTDADDGAQVGSFAEEAGRLVAALSGWAVEHARETGDGLSDLGEQAAAAAHELNGHLSTGSAECTVCPICRGINVLRQLSPEVTVHLSSAVSSLAQAAAALMATQVPHDEAPESGIDQAGPVDGGAEGEG